MYVVIGNNDSSVASKFFDTFLCNTVDLMINLKLIVQYIDNNKKLC